MPLTVARVPKPPALAGMERQALRHAMLRYHAEGPCGPHDQPRSVRPEGLSPGPQAALKALRPLLPASSS
jgi:hypothetical protein